jgi:hypothetical protein
MSIKWAKSIKPIRVEVDFPVVAIDGENPGPYVAVEIVAHAPVLAVTQYIKHMCALSLLQWGAHRHRLRCLHLVTRSKIAARAEKIASTAPPR